MKKYIAFFISVGLLLTTILIYNTMGIEEKRKVTFAESGYILNNSTERFYFYENETYTTSYNNQIVFYDTEGQKVTLNNDNFIHYTSGNIVALQESVLLDLNKIDENPILYYNISSNKEIKKISNRYVVKNLNNDLQFEQAIWKISSNKYIILGKKIKIKLENGTEKEIEGYIEIEYSDNEIINIYNQEISYQTIASESYVELNNGIKINLGKKIVSKNNENKMSLEDMVINSNDNVTLVDLNDKEESENENEVDDNETPTQDANIGSTIGNAAGGTTNSISSSNSTINSNSQTTGIINGEVTGDSAENTNQDKNENKIEIETPDILYKDSDDSEIEVDLSQTLAEPVFKLENTKITAIGISGKIQITDDNDLLSKDDNINIKIINNNTGKTVYTQSENYGVYNIRLGRSDTGINNLLPNTQYTIIASGTYIVNEIEYKKNFLYKSFKTSEIGIVLNKEGFTDKEMNFSISFTDKLIASATVSILDINGTKINENEIRNINNGELYNVNFQALNSNTEYIVKISNIAYNGSTQVGDNWAIENKFKTLKSKVSIEQLNYSINKRDGIFKLYIDKIIDKDESIQNYKYIIYKYNEENVYTSKDIVYQKETTDKEIAVNVKKKDEELEGDGVVRGTAYVFKVIANSYDNEKYVETESNLQGTLILNAKSFPTVRFVEESISATEIKGNLIITDNDATLVVNNDNPLIIKYKNDIEEEQTYVTYTNIGDIRNSETGEIGITINNCKGLKKKTSYVFSVYGSVNLEEYDEDKKETILYRNVLIGNAIITTKEYNTLTANFEKKQDTTNAFNVNFKLDGNDYEKESVASVTFAIQAGQNYNEGFDLAIKTITKDDYEGDEKKFTKALCKDGINLNPNLFTNYKGNWNENKYMIIASVTVDSTKYKNEIPLKCNKNDSDEDRGNINYKYEDGNIYNGAFVIIDGQKTTAPSPDNPETKINVKPITNKEYPEYVVSDKEKKDMNLYDDTIVAYKVNSLYEPKANEKNIESITFYLWDNEGVEITREVMSVDNNDEIKNKSYIFEVGYGLDPNEQNETNNYKQLHRGGAYYFSYTIEYENEDKYWPKILDDKYDNFSANSGIIYPLKQEPKFNIFPANSESDGITYKYYCYDPDYAMELVNNDNEGMYLYMKTDVSTTTEEVDKYNIKYDRDKSNIEFNDIKVGYGANGDGKRQYKLISGKEYLLTYKSMLNIYSSDYTNKSMITLLTQKFEDELTLSDITLDVSYDTNKINIALKDINDNNSNLKKVAAADVSIKDNEGTIRTTTKTLENSADGYFINVDITKDIEDGEEFVGKDVTVKVILYYDNGKIGFLPTTHIDENLFNDCYVTYVKYEDNQQQYMIIDSNGELSKNEDGIGGSAFKVNKFKYGYDEEENTNMDIFKLQIENLVSGQNLDTEMNCTSSGIEYGGGIILQKELGEYNAGTATLTIDNIVLGFENVKIKSNLTDATISADIINPVNYTIQKMYCELFEKDNGTIKWDKVVQSIDMIENVTNNKIELTIDGLNPATYYAIRFKYKLNEEDEEYIYMYNADKGITPGICEFETIADIGIKNIAVNYNAISYNEKTLNISYNVDEEKSTKYWGTKYVFYDSKGNKIDLKDENIVDMKNKIEKGNLIVVNNQTESFSEVNEKININPENNLFTFGEKYTIQIIPMIEVNENIQDLKKYSEQEFDLESLKEPAVTIKAIRKENNKLSVNVNVSDPYKVMVDGKYTITVSGGNINQNAEKNIGTTNEPLTIEGCDFTISNYTINVSYSANITNKNNNNAIKNKNITKIISKINNDGEIDPGKMEISPEGETSIAVKFTESYNITKVDEIVYSVYEDDRNIINETLKESKIDWKTGGTNEFDKFSYFILENTKFTNNKQYKIIIQLYYKSTFIGQFEKSDYKHIVTTK